MAARPSSAAQRRWQSCFRRAGAVTATSPASLDVGALEQLERLTALQRVAIGAGIDESAMDPMTRAPTATRMLGQLLTRKQKSIATLATTQVDGIAALWLGLLLGCCWAAAGLSPASHSGRRASTAALVAVRGLRRGTPGARLLVAVAVGTHGLVVVWSSARPARVAPAQAAIPRSRTTKRVGIFGCPSWWGAVTSVASPARFQASVPGPLHRHQHAPFSRPSTRL